MQNKPYFVFWKQGFPKGGREGSNIWEKFPKNTVFFGWLPLGAKAGFLRMGWGIDI